MKKMVFVYLILIIVLGGFAITKAGYIKLPNFNMSVINKAPYAEVNNAQINLILAKTPDEQVTGLSKTDKLNQDSGMLFIFKQKDFFPFWMKDMKFPIDIIYINDNKVIDVFTNAKPPSNSPTVLGIQIYRPKEIANYVLEVPAGTAQKHNIKTGNTITLKNIY